MATKTILQSWSEGPTRKRLIEFLDHASDVPVERRVAVFDNDGTLWCEKPAYTQLAFFLHELHAQTAARPEMASRAEYAALLNGVPEAFAEFGLERIAFALVELFAAIPPEEFEVRVREFVRGEQHPKGMPYARTVYQPMLELLDALRARGFAAFVVSGGGMEFVRAIARELYGVDPEGVVGTGVTYELRRTAGGPVLLRTAKLLGEANEGPAKIENIQYHLGRRPIFAAGNSAGDQDMLEYVASGVDTPTLSLLVDHDDGEREYAYASEAGTFKAKESIVDVARRSGWCVVSMKNDWTSVFPDAAT